MTGFPTAPPLGLAGRMKAAEQVTRSVLPRRTYTAIRVDGRAFHTYTRGLRRPFDEQFAADMDAAALALVLQVSGAFCAYVQSDEISVIAQDFAAPGTQPWFGGQVQKMVSVSASAVTAEFNARRPLPGRAPALFDARVFTLPSATQVESYLIWRQRDAIRNSISMAAQSQFPHRRLQGLNSLQCKQLLADEAGIHWDTYPAGFRFGRVLTLQPATAPVTFTRGDTGETITTHVDRLRWTTQPAEQFAPGGWLRPFIPLLPAEDEQATA